MSHVEARHPNFSIGEGVIHPLKQEFFFFKRVVFKTEAKKNLMRSSFQQLNIEYIFKFIQILRGKKKQNMIVPTRYYC